MSKDALRIVIKFKLTQAFVFVFVVNSNVAQSTEWNIDYHHLCLPKDDPKCMAHPPES